MTEHLKICFDKILARDFNRPHRALAVGDPMRAILVIRKMWPNGQTLGVRFMGGTPEQKTLAQEQADWWSQHANLKFEFNNAADAQIRISYDPSDGAWSFVGTDCLNIPKNQATMNLGFQDGGTSGHEFGHAIGLGHEHQNPAGGIEWNEDVVIRDLAGAPNFWTPEQTRHNVIRKYNIDQINGTEFDADSIMLYAFPGSWTKSGQSTHANEVLSHLDTAFIASELAYPPGEIPEPVDLPVIDTAGITASIGKAGEEDMFKFTATTADRYTIETGGQTDVVMKLFGPGSTTDLIAEDDDGGAGRNSRIVADLSPGEYFVQIRHYNTAGGTGDYAIKVSK
jgi:hypothetical protein